MAGIEELVEKYSGQPDTHITRVLCCWVVVQGGDVVEVDHSQALHKCPLQSRISDAGVEDYIREKIREFGHFTPERQVVRDSIAIPFGTSEMLMYAIRKGVLDCAVTACGGAGTVVSDKPEVVQGIGARMNGLFHTSPIAEIIEQLRDHDATVFDDAAIDQVRGLKTAIDAGYRKIGVTVNLCRGERLAELRAMESEFGVEVTMAGICSTGADEKRAIEAAANCDLAWTCASRHLRETGISARMQVTHGIPILVYTGPGMDLVASYSDEEGARVLGNLDPHAQYLLGARQSERPVKLGEKTLYLAEAELPVRGGSCPDPLR